MASGFLTILISLLILLLFGATPLVLWIVLNPVFLSIVLLLICALIATLLTGFLGKYYLRPIKAVSEATKEVRNGNYKIQVRNPDESKTEMGELIDNFNSMVRELDGIELFRSDFVNNFSHEFKTPIVSIRGFAKELQLGNLTEEQRLEYAKIIAEESDRLAKLASDVLELSKLENQTIVTDREDYRLDEQLRRCVLLLEKQWSEKELEPDSQTLLMTTALGLAPLAFAVTGARALRTTCRLGTVLHIVGGAIGLGIMVLLTVLGALEVLTPANMFLYQLAWMIPGWIVTEWTRSV